MKVYTDAARDDEISAMGWKIVLSDGTVHKDNRYLTGSFTSMEAEYFALLDGLRYAQYHDEAHVSVLCDCQPLIEKMRTPDGHDQDWYDRRQGCHRLLNKFDSWSLKWTPRSGNADADRLAYEALERGRQEMEETETFIS